MNRFLMITIVSQLFFLNSGDLWGLTAKSIFSQKQSRDSVLDALTSSSDTYSVDALPDAIIMDIMLFLNIPDMPQLINAAKIFSHQLKGRLKNMPDSWWRSQFIQKIEGKNFRGISAKKLNKKYPKMKHIYKKLLIFLILDQKNLLSKEKLKVFYALCEIFPEATRMAWDWYKKHNKEYKTIASRIKNGKPHKLNLRTHAMTMGFLAVIFSRHKKKLASVEALALYTPSKEFVAPKKAFPRLKKLYLHNTELKKFVMSRKLLPQLQELYLDHTRFEEFIVPKEIFPKLKILSLGNTPLKAFVALKGAMPKLQTLYLHNTQLQDFIVSKEAFPKLQFLALNNTLFMGMGQKILHKLTQKQGVYIIGTKFVFDNLLSDDSALRLEAANILKKRVNTLFDITNQSNISLFAVLESFLPSHKHDNEGLKKAIMAILDSMTNSSLGEDEVSFTLSPDIQTIRVSKNKFVEELKDFLVFA